MGVVWFDWMVDGCFSFFFLGGGSHRVLYNIKLCSVLLSSGVCFAFGVI